MPAQVFILSHSPTSSQFGPEVGGSGGACYCVKALRTSRTYSQISGWVQVGDFSKPKFHWERQNKLWCQHHKHPRAPMQAMAALCDTVQKHGKQREFPINQSPRTNRANMKQWQPQWQFSCPHLSDFNIGLNRRIRCGAGHTEFMASRCSNSAITSAPSAWIAQDLLWMNSSLLRMA